MCSRTLDGPIRLIRPHNPPLHQNTQHPRTSSTRRRSSLASPSPSAGGDPTATSPGPPPRTTTGAATAPPTSKARAGGYVGALGHDVGWRGGSRTIERSVARGSHSHPYVCPPPPFHDSGAKLSHDHATQFTYVYQSLRLWRCVRVLSVIITPRPPTLSHALIPTSPHPHPTSTSTTGRSCGACSGCGTRRTRTS